MNMKNKYKILNTNRTLHEVCLDDQYPYVIYAVQLCISVFLIIKYNIDLCHITTRHDIYHYIDISWQH